MKRTSEAQWLPKNISLTELSRLSKVPYRTLQDIVARKQAARITTVAAIAGGLGMPPGKLLEDPSSVEAQEAPKSRERLLVSLIEKSLKLDDNSLALVLRTVEIRLEGLHDDSLRDVENDE